MAETIQPGKVSGKLKSTLGSMLSAPATDVALTSDKSVKVEEKESDNPFHMPSDNDIFFLRDKERQRRKEERARMRALKPHEKTTYSSRINSKKSDILKDIKAAEKDLAVVEEKDSVKEDPQWTLSVTRDRHVEKEDLAEYIAKKREMFLVQYSLGVKRDEMRKLEEIALAEERKLELAEQYLEEDAAMFDEFLKENDKNSVEAIKIAEAETKAKLEKVQDIKRLNAQMMHIKSEISKYEDTLKEYQLYKKFLDSLTPQEWKDKKREERRIKNAKKAAAAGGGVAAPVAPAAVASAGAAPGKPSGKGAAGPPASQGGGKGGKGGGTLQSKGAAPATKQVTPVTGAGRLVPASSAVVPAPSELQVASDESDDDDLELYFHDPQQLLDIFAELEEQNLSLIQNSQETEEALEEMKQNIASTKNKMEAETEVLKQQIAVLEDAIQREDERAKELELRSKMFSFGEYKADEQEKMLQQLNKKVEEVYRSCIGDNEANISTLQMLTNIENRLEELFVTIETMPADKVAEAEKAKEKERRMRLREEKLDQQRRNQEERLRRALERAKADIKRKTGKPLVFRSQPPQMKKKDDGDEQLANKEEEEMAYFFQW